MYYKHIIKKIGTKILFQEIILLLPKQFSRFLSQRYDFLNMTGTIGNRRF